MEKNIQQATSFLLEMEVLIKQSSTNWLFSLHQASALDAHLVTFIARLLDVGRSNLVPKRVLEYAKKAWEGEEWKGVMQGRSTDPRSLREQSVL